MSTLLDWVLIVMVVALVVAVYVGMSNMIDHLIAFWRAHKDEA